MPKRRIGHTGDIISHPLVGLFKTLLPVVHQPFVEGGGAAMLTRPRQWNFLGVFLGPVVVVGSWLTYGYMANRWIQSKRVSHKGPSSWILVFILVAEGGAGALVCFAGGVEWSSRAHEDL